MIRSFGGFRTHLLLPHDVVGTIIDDKPTWTGLEMQAVDNGVFWLRHDKIVMSLHRKQTRHGWEVTIFPHGEIWVQEPALTVVSTGRGTWRGYRRDPFKWTSREYPLDMRDAHRATVHFPRSPRTPGYTQGVQHIQDDRVYRFWSDGRFTDLLEDPPGMVPWQGCEVFGEGYELAGVYPDPGVRPLRRWELAGHENPTEDWMHFLGWGGGPACVVNADGRDVGAPGDTLLWDPRSWRKLRKVSQTIGMRSV